MKWLNRLERRYGRFSVKDLMVYIVIINGIVFLLSVFNPGADLIGRLALIPSLVLKGEVWRLVTYIFIPPSSSIVFIVFTLYFYYLIGSSLEQQWGSFKFNVYYLVGMIATTIAAFISGLGVTSSYLNLSLFLAFAHLFPNFEILLFFILPVKIKYLAWLNWAIIAYSVIFMPIHLKAAALASVANYLLFFNMEIIRGVKQRIRVYKNRRKFRNAFKGR